jgi:hypothetical protein
MPDIVLLTHALLIDGNLLPDRCRLHVDGPLTACVWVDRGGPALIMDPGAWASLPPRDGRDDEGFVAPLALREHRCVAWRGFAP